MLEKHYLKSKPKCKVKFIAPKAISEDAKNITLAGEFNDWNPAATKLKKQRDGIYATTIELEVGHEYQYRYVVDGERWENDWTADRYVPNNISADDNSVVIV